MADPEEVEEWLKKADEDWRVSEILLKSGEELTLPCMFHLQQMLEKLLKASILVAGSRIEKTHDLNRLARQGGVQAVNGLLDLCDTCNIFAVNGRYPGDLPEVTISAARNYFEQAGRVRRDLLKHISS